MVSILGDYNYTFPKPIPLKLKLKDMLEDNVDEKYFLSDAMMNYMMSESSGGISRKEMFERNFNKKEDVASTITTMAGQRASDNFIKVKNATKKGYLEATDGDGIDLAQPNSETRRGRVQKNSIQTLTTQNNLGVVSDLRIRKLTPKECFRLMGVKDEDFDKVAKNQSDSSLYHLAGDSLITTIMMALFSQMLDISWQEHFNSKEWWNNE